MTFTARPYTEVSGTIAIASSINREIQGPYDMLNGTINSQNLANSGVRNQALGLSAVTPTKVDAATYAHIVMFNEEF